MGRGKEYIKKMQKYITDVESGERNAGELERLAVQRHLDDLKYSVERGIYWDEKAAMKALSFFTLLRHYQGEWAGKELILEGWQCFIIGSLFGWKKAGGVRRFNTAYVEVSRKTGKRYSRRELACTFFTWTMSKGHKCSVPLSTRNRRRSVGMPLSP